MKKRLPLILFALTVVLLFALPFAVSAANAANATAEQFDLETGRTYWFDLSGTGIPGTVNDKLPDKTLHYVPFTYAGTVSAYTLLQAMVPTESEMEYEHSLFISEYNITHTVSWNELNKKDLIFRNLTEYNGVPYYIHAPSGGARYDTGPFNNEWQRIFEKNSGFIKNSYDMVEADGIVSTQDSWCQDTNPNATREFRVVRSGGGSGFYSYPPDRATRMTAYRPVLEIALAYGMEYPQNYMKAVTLNLNGGSVGGNTGDISIVVKNIEVLDPSYPAVTFLAPTKEGLTRPDGNTGTYFMWRGDNGELYAPGDAVPNEVNSLTALWVEHGHCVCGGDADFDGHTSHTAVEWTAWDKTDSLPTTAGNYYLKNDILIDGQFEINESVNICLNGKKIRAGSSIPENRYMLTVKGSNALTITDCGGNGTIVGADTKGISVTQDATLTMYGGTIRDFLCGVGVSGTFRMTGNAHITACRESGISLHGAYGRGTQVYLSGNAAVTDCVSSASGSGAGIHINSGSTLFLSGNIRFSGNRYQNPDTGETWGDDILIDYGAIWSFVSNPRKYEYPPVRINGTLDKDLQISFNVGWNLQEAMATRIKTNPVRLIGGENYTLTAADLTHFITTRNAWEGYIFAYDEETSGIVMRLDHYHCVCGGSTAVGDHTSHIDMGWAPWAGTDDLPCNYNSVIYSTIKDGYWYLTDDVTLDREYNGSFSDCMRLCLHGKTITLTENACIKITKGELIITDCTGQGKIVFPKDGIAVEKKYQAGKLTLFGGTIRGSANGDSDRTGIRVMNGAEFLMYGGVIEKFGHGVGAEGAFTMYGGTIRDCHVIGNGGGVLVSTGGAFLMKGGSIKDCSAWNGGGICADGGTLTLAGGTISECSAITAGGGIATFDFTAFELGGTVISDCEAWQGGGVRSLSSSAQAVMTGGKITGCRSTDPRCNALYLGDNIDFRALGGRIEGTVCTADGTKITGSATGTIFTDVVYHAFNAGTFSGLRFEGNGRIVYEYRVYYYSASGILLYINNENAGDVYGDGTVSYDDAAKTLTLNGVTLTGQQMLGATDLPDTLTVVLIGNNVFENDKRGISHTGGDLLIKGTGALRAGWIENKNDIIIESGDIVLDSRGTASGALGTYDNRLVVKGGTLTLIGDPSALYRNGAHTVIADLIPGMRMLAGNAADGSDATEISDETYKDKTYLRFEARTYRVIFAPGNDGTGSSTTIIKDYDTTVTLPGALFTRTGYTQTGWRNADGTKTYPLGGTYTENAGITLYPVWTPNRYTITFDTAGGSDIAPITQDYGTAIVAPADPTREGYTFIGWDKAIPATMPAENVTITAKWKVNSYTITFDTAGGSAVAPITQNYGTAITAPTNPTREGYTFIGWDKAIPTTMPAENVTVTAKWKVNQYTITFDTAGGSEIAPITQDYGTAIVAPADPTREGYTFVGWDKAIPTTMPAENVMLKAKWKDTEKPTGEIIIGTNKWSEFLNELTSGLFFKDAQEVTINAADNSGIVFISYLVTDQDLSEEELGSLVYRAYEEPFRIDPNGEYIVYAMLVDESLNITYLRSDRITLDNIPPVISGIEDGKTYCEAQTVTINEKYTDTVTVNGTPVTLDENGSFVLSPANGKQKIVVTDKAGNTAEMTVTVNDGHTLLADDNDCTTPVYCKFCNEEVIAAKSHRFTGNWQNDETAHWHICQNENCTVTDRKTAHSGEDDGNCLTAVVCECGYVITAAKPAHTFNEWTSNGNGTHTRKCTVVGCNGIETENCSGGKATCTDKAVCTVCHTGYGDALGHNFTIAQHDETHHWNKCSRCDATDAKAVHTGGTATCREKAVCEVCRSVYGKLSTTNHVGGTEIRDDKPQSCSENGYTGDTYCKGCGEKLSSGTVIHADGHKGGTATCTDKAECEVCHEKYGEPDANHHTGMEMVDAVPATAASTGTVAHWRCTACGKLFADADGKREIRSEDTVTKKLAPSILDGANGEWRKGDENGLTFSSDAEFSDFVEVLVDGKPVASENYERQGGGIIVELKASYLETLAEGEHTLTIRSASGDATTRFTIAASNSTNAWVWIIIGFIALGIGVTVAVFVIRKRKTA